MLHSLRDRYDYIIIDTPPVGIVSDTLVLMNHADINVFIVRENYSKKEYIKTINEIHEQGKQSTSASCSTMPAPTNATGTATATAMVTTATAIMTKKIGRRSFQKPKKA